MGVCGVKREAEGFEVLCVSVVGEAGGELSFVWVEGGKSDCFVEVNKLSGEEVKFGASSVGVDEGLNVS